jgi:hypothetical protein
MLSTGLFGLEKLLGTMAGAVAKGLLPELGLLGRREPEKGFSGDANPPITFPFVFDRFDEPNEIFEEEFENEVGPDEPNILKTLNKPTTLRRNYKLSLTCMDNTYLAKLHTRYILIFQSKLVVIQIDSERSGE